MATEGKKRKAPTQTTSLINSRKRQKLQNAKSKAKSILPSSKKPTPSPAQQAKVWSAGDLPPRPSKKEARLTHLDDLGWHEVSVPDQLDDYEGFFGLEEVDDVEVVRAEDGSKVSFRVVGEKDKNEGGGVGEDTADTYIAVKEALKGAGNGAKILEDEWEGFSDAEGKAAAHVAVEGGMESRLKKIEREKLPMASVAKPKPETKEKKSKKDRGATGQKPIGTIPFAGILDGESIDVEVDTKDWQPLGLLPETLSALSTMGFERPTPIQNAAIPDIMAGHDVVGKASTGSGKTLAFGIPILERYLHAPRLDVPSERREMAPLALILAPTRELAHQIGKHLTALCNQASFSGPRIVIITGGLSIQKQQRQLSTADIIIGTPGRLWEVMGGGHGFIARLRKLQFLVVDEADRLLSEGNFKEVEEILNALDRTEQADDDEEDEEVQVERQTLVFSATFHKGLQQKLAGKSRPSGDLMSKQESMEYLLKKLKFREEKPKFIDVNPDSQMASRLKEGLVECAGTEKDLYLYSLLMLYPKTRALVFTNSISAVRRLTPYLQHLTLPAHALHSSMPQKARLRAVERFISSPSAIMIATDVAARGLDIPGVQLVVHYHLPRTADMYVHRSGRTARAEKGGSSVIICAPEEVMGVKRLVAKVHARSGLTTDAKYSIRSLDLDRRLVSRLKSRATLAKKIADVGIAKEKGNATDQIFQQAAEDLGVEYNSEEFEGTMSGRSGRGNARKKKEREERGVGRDQMGAWKAELRDLLAKRVNVGVSERYLTSGSVDIDALLRGEPGEFLGMVSGLGLDE